MFGRLIVLADSLARKALCVSHHFSSSVTLLVTDTLRSIGEVRYVTFSMANRRLLLLCHSFFGQTLKTCLAVAQVNVYVSLSCTVLCSCLPFVTGRWHSVRSWCYTEMVYIEWCFRDYSQSRGPTRFVRAYSLVDIKLIEDQSDGYQVEHEGLCTTVCRLLTISSQAFAYTSG